MKKTKKAKGAKKTASKSAPSKKAKAGITPLGDRVLVKPTPPEEVTSFGLIIPDSAKEKPEQGVVVAVGPGKKTDEGRVIPVSVKVGEKIMFNKYGFDEVKINGTEYYLISEQNILAVLN